MVARAVNATSESLYNGSPPYAHFMSEGDGYAAIAQLGDVDFRWHEPLARYTTYRIGGPVKCLAAPRTEKAFEKLLARVRAEGIPFFLLGGGSNILAPDEPWDAIVIKLGEAFSVARHLGQDEEGLESWLVGAGARLSRWLRCCIERGHEGMEWSVGIPGSVGGAIVMNAGAHGGCMADVLRWIDIVDGSGHRQRIQRSDLTPVYRSMQLPNDWIVLGACFALRKGSRESLMRRSAELMRQRRRSQPCGSPSAGSVFKNPPGFYAGALIEQCGLKGLRRGDACVSSRHANWIVNYGRATARDVIGLMEMVESEVHRCFGILLEREVQVVGR